MFALAGLQPTTQNRAEDLVQEVFISAFEHIGSFDPRRGSLRTWLRRGRCHHCFVLGDHRAQSQDSRVFGPVPLADVKGRLEYVYWPSDDWTRFGRYPY